MISCMRKTILAKFKFSATIAVCKKSKKAQTTKDYIAIVYALFRQNVDLRRLRESTYSLTADIQTARRCFM